MLNAPLFRFAWRMQRIRKQKESGYKFWFGGAEHRGLASTVGVAAEKNSSRDTLAHNRNRIAQTGAIAFCIARKRRPGSPLLAKRKIAAQHHVAMSGKSRADCHQKRCVAIRACAVSQDQRIAVWICRRVQEAADGGIQLSI